MAFQNLEGHFFNSPLAGKIKAPRETDTNSANPVPVPHIERRRTHAIKSLGYGSPFMLKKFPVHRIEDLIIAREDTMNHFALTIIGRDRPGIVAEVTEVLYQLGCNIADSSCTLLGGQFAMILIVSSQEIGGKEPFIDAFSAIEQGGLSVFVRMLKPGGELHPDLRGEICMISVYGSDKPGIVYRVTRELSTRRINITDLNTKLVGTKDRPVYVMMLEALLPEGQTEEDLRAIMAGLKDELQVDISVRSITPVEL